MYCGDCLFHSLERIKIKGEETVTGYQVCGNKNCFSYNLHLGRFTVACSSMVPKDQYYTKDETEEVKKEAV